MKHMIPWLFVATWVLAACNYPAAGMDDASAAPRAWIDRPLEESEFLLGDVIPIQWHATGDDGVRLVEVRINGDLLQADDSFDPYLFLVQGELNWNPGQAGEYLVQVVATGPDEAVGPPAENRVTVFAEGGTVAGMVAKDLNQDGDSDDEGEGPLEGATVVVVECGDKRSMVTAAGGSFEFTDLPLGSCVLDAYKDGWHFAGTFPPGLDFPIHFSPDPEAPIAFTVYLSQEATPTPEPTATRTPPPFIPTVPPVIVPPVIPTLPAPDNQPPPAPAIISPRDEVILGCLTNIVLLWQAVEDASGIDTYDVALGISYDNGASWSGAGTLGLEFTTVQINDQTDCGNLYRWRVRARDNVGNVGPWSAWERFGIGID